MTARSRFWSIVAGTVLALAGGVLLFGSYQDELDAPCGGGCA